MVSAIKTQAGYRINTAHIVALFVNSLYTDKGFEIIAHTVDDRKWVLGTYKTLAAADKALDAICALTIISEIEVN